MYARKSRILCGHAPSPVEDTRHAHEGEAGIYAAGHTRRLTFVLSRGQNRDCFIRLPS